MLPKEKTMANGRYSEEIGIDGITGNGDISLNWKGERYGIIAQ
jgi:hypothetical protein